MSIFNNNKNKEENEKTKRQPNVKRGLVVLATVGGVAYLCGRISGIQDGYRRGFDNGILHTVNHFAEGMKVLAENAEESKGK